MRVGITGAKGFIGTHLVRALNSKPDISIHCFSCANDSAVPLPEEMQDFIKDKDLIYHLAGVNRGTDETILRGNILTTLNLLTALKTFGQISTRIVFASSSQVYSLSGHREGITETQPTEPETPYGISKKAAEDLIRISGFEHVILRLANVYGPLCRPNYNSVIATFCDRAAHGQELSINGDGSQGRDFIYIDDVIQALTLAGTERRKDDENVYNVGSAKLTPLNEVVKTMQEAGAAVKPTFRPEKNGGVSYWCDSSRFQDRYQWTPKTTLANGIQNTHRWFKEGQPS